MIENLVKRLKPELRGKLRNLEGLAAAAVLSQRTKISGVHLLILMLDIPDGIAGRVFRGFQLDPTQLRDELQDQFRGNGTTVDRLCEEHTEADLWARLTELSEWDQSTAIRESDLIAVALETLTQNEAENLTDWVQEPLHRLTATARQMDIEVTTIELFDDSGGLLMDSFAADARQVITMTHREANALGKKSISRDLLMLGMLIAGGLLPTAIRAQAIDPGPIQENLLLNLRRLGRRRRREFPLDKEHIHSGVQRLLDHAALSASRDGRATIEEGHLIRALVHETYGLAYQSLVEGAVKIDALTNFVVLESVWRGEDDHESEVEIPDPRQTEAELRSAVIGQSDAIDAVMPLLKRYKFGHRRVDKPGGVFLFMGVSGTGKTMTAKAIAKAVYGSEDSLLVLEMGQFKTDVSINQFIGAPPGYVGFGQGILTNGLRDNPESVILFDEVEKASEQVYDALLRFLDEGLISDPSGPVRDGSKCLIVLTSNIAPQELEQIGFQDRREKSPAEIQCLLRDLALKYFKRPELVNRIDELVLFSPLGFDDYAAILNRQLDVEKNWFLREKQITLTVDPEFVQSLSLAAFARAQEGARVVDKIVTTRLISPLIDFLVSEEIEPPITVTVLQDSKENPVFRIEANR